MILPLAISLEISVVIELKCSKLDMFFSENVDTIATGGKGDREIFVYKASKLGKLSKQHCLRGHTGMYVCTHIFQRYLTKNYWESINC